MNYYTVNEVAELLRVAHGTVRREITRGRLETCRVGRAIRVSEEQLERYLSKPTLTPPTAPAPRRAVVTRI